MQIELLFPTDKHLLIPSPIMHSQAIRSPPSSHRSGKPQRGVKSSGHAGDSHHRITGRSRVCVSPKATNQLQHSLEKVQGEKGTRLGTWTRILWTTGGQASGRTGFRPVRRWSWKTLTPFFPAYFSLQPLLRKRDEYDYQTASVGLTF